MKLESEANLLCSSSGQQVSRCLLWVLWTIGATFVVGTQLMMAQPYPADQGGWEKGQDGEQIEKLQDKLDYLLKVVTEQQNQINGLKEALENAVGRMSRDGPQSQDQPAHVVVLSNPTESAESPAAPLQSLSSQKDPENPKILKTLQELSSKFVFLGDLRERWQSDLNRRDDQPARNRARTRLRLGFNYGITEDLQVGFRIRTGQPDDARSPHQTFGNVFHSWPFALDRAYLKFKPSFLPSNRLAAVTVGKFANAFMTTEGLWDDDVNPEGIAAEFGFTRLGWLDEVKVTGAQYIIVERNLGRDAGMTGAQLQARKSFAGDSSATLALSLYDYHHLDPIGTTSVSDRHENLFIDQRLASQFRVVDIMIKGDLRLKHIPLSPYADVFQNTRGYDSQRAGIWAGVSVGGPKKRKDWGITYLYGHIERDATLGAFSQDDFLAGTNYRGHRVQFLYNVLDKVQIKPEFYTTRLLTTQSGTNPKTEVTFRLNTEIRF